MKINFDDGSFCEIRQNDDGKLILIIQAKDHQNELKKITNCCELTKEEFDKLISDIR